MFLFHTGSIKRNLFEYCSFSVRFQFRFHTGSIKRSCYRGKCREVCHRFDSILVRLKELIDEQPETFYQQFLFHTGPIKRQEQLEESVAFMRFYSILVRLKVGLPNDSDYAYLKFLFHTGSIKSQPIDLLDISLPSFLFHTGSIKRIAPIVLGLVY